MSAQSLESFARWAGAVTIAALGVAVFVMAAPDERGAPEDARPAGDVRAPQPAPVVTARNASRIAPR